LNKHYNKKQRKRIEELTKYYINSSKVKEKKQNEYRKRFIARNPITGEILNDYTVKGEFEKKKRDVKSKSYHFQNEAIEENFHAIAITGTLNSKYHKENLFKENGINEGYKVLHKTLVTEIIRELAKVRSNRDIIDKRYIRVIEPHKSLIPHLHGLIYAKPEDIEEIIRVIENKVKCGNNKKWENERTLILNENAKKNNGKIGRVQIDILKNDTVSTSNYILKYLSKNLNDNDSYLLDGWYRANKIRLVTTSKIPLTKAIYSKLYYCIDKEVREELIKENKNILDYMIDNTRVIYIEDNKEIIKHNPNNNPKYIVNVVKETVIKMIKISNTRFKMIKYKKIVDIIIIKDNKVVYQKSKKVDKLESG
jgi:hypothetical protein